MKDINGAISDLKNLDQLALGATPVHRLDPRAKVLVTLFFIISVNSYGKYEVSALLPNFVFPVFLMTVGRLPSGYIAKKTVMIIPFVMIAGIFNTVYDRTELVDFGSFVITGGWISLISIVLRAVLSVGSAIVLTGVTGFPAILNALGQLGMPKGLVLQMNIFYRYIFVLAEEGSRMARARELRSFYGKGKDIRTSGALIGTLFLRTWHRAERIHMAMMSRGFNGDFHMRKVFKLGKKEVLFIFFWIMIFFIFRIQNIPMILGGLVERLLQ